jgi:hypothetical protein
VIVELSQQKRNKEFDKTIAIKKGHKAPPIFTIVLMILFKNKVTHS